MKFEFSAGGVVYRKEKDKTYILVAQHSQHHGWVFPKGWIDREKKETKEEAALREVREETGIIGKILEPLEPVIYWFNNEGEKIKKTVYYYIMEFAGGDIDNHDDEMEKVEWLDKEKIAERLTYKSDKDVWKEAEQLIN